MTNPTYKVSDPVLMALINGDYVDDADIVLAYRLLREGKEPGTPELNRIHVRTVADALRVKKYIEDADAKRKAQQQGVT